MTFDDTITGVPPHRGAIHLRTTEPKRKPETPKDLRAAEGIILSVLIGANVLIWTYIAVRWFT